MTELETIERAKMYVDKMARGIDPLSDRPAAETDMINQVRISRCLFFVSDVLRRVIENGGVGAKRYSKPRIKRADRKPFSLSAEQIASFEYSEEGIGAGELAGRINSLIDKEEMKPLQPTAITDWLVEMGFLERCYNGFGHEYKRPTQKGAAFGIKPESRVTPDRTYEIVAYGPEAQHFVLDNIEAVVSSENVRRGRQGDPWSREEEDYLADLIHKGMPLGEISLALKRDSSAVRSRAKKLGLIMSEHGQ